MSSPSASSQTRDTRRESRRQAQPQAETRQEEESRPKTSLVTCFFNTTLMSATIYTRMRASFPQSVTDLPNPVNASRTGFAPWPYRVEITERDPDVTASNSNSTAGATTVPDCRDATGRVVTLSDLIGTAASVDDNGSDGGGLSIRWIEADTILRRIKRRGFRKQNGGVEDEKSTTTDNENECSCRYANYELVGKGQQAGEEGEGGEGDSNKDPVSSSSGASSPPPTASTAEPTLTPTPTPTPMNAAPSENERKKRKR